MQKYMNRRMGLVGGKILVILSCMTPKLLFKTELDPERVTRIFIKRYDPWNYQNENQYLTVTWEYPRVLPPAFPRYFY